MIQATRRRRVLCREMAAAMENLDIIVSASQPGEAPRIDSVPKWANMEKPSFTMPFNVTGFPAISICTGFGEGGLPVCDAIGRQAVHRADPVPGRACLRSRDEVAREAAGYGRLNSLLRARHSIPSAQCSADLLRSGLPRPEEVRAPDMMATEWRAPGKDMAALLTALMTFR